MALQTAAAKEGYPCDTFIDQVFQPLDECAKAQSCSDPRQLTNHR